MDINLFDLSGSSVGTVSFDHSVLGDSVRIRLLHQAVKMYEANKRVGTAQAKTRSEVAGQRKKPWRQKGTGRARSGTKQSPIWVGGGVVFGPRARDYSWTMPKKSRKLALKSALLSKFQDDEVIAITGIELDSPKTKAISGFLNKTGMNEHSVLFVVNSYDKNVILSVRNVPNAAVDQLSNLNAYDILKYKRIVFTQEALSLLGEEATR